MREELQRLLSESISVEPKICLNYLRKDIGCRQCVDYCPTQAISFQTQIPVIQHSKCINCGACVSACPVLAIDHVQKPYQVVKKQIEEHPQAQITCERMESYQKGIKIPCYLYLDLPLLLSYGKGKEVITFTIEPCQNCEKAEWYNPKEHLKKLREELKSYSLSIPLRIQLTMDPLTDPNDEIVDGITRRELLKKLSIKNLREVFLPKEEEEKEESKVDRLTKKEKTFYKRNLFNQIVFQHNKKNGYGETTLPETKFLKLEINDSCVGCNICETLCPTEALYWENEENVSQLLFTAEHCIACQNCLSCPENSIQIKPIALNEYLSAKPSVLKMFDRKICIKCGDEFRSRIDGEICPICKVQNEKDPMRFFI
ncbi:4Fe-4S dicluster domain-containing protein [Tepidibacillus sp. LV47]|uniref:4Fe-4S dicluster domain-containing protein n=1 Tax=Tepidibacillus sp. LV47 TaxID=3398228 RepID=UPI003AAC9A9D